MSAGVGGIFITGTDTDVGKTVVTAGLAAVLERRRAVPGGVRLWKPAQSGFRAGEPGADSYRLVMASGVRQTEASTASYSFAAPLAPWTAAAREGRQIDMPALVAAGRQRLAEAGLLLVEGAGGLLVPLTGEQLVADLAVALGLPLLIVARPGLGTVNHTLLTVRTARSLGLDVIGVVLNGCRAEQAEAARDNAQMIERFGAVPVLGVLPWLGAEPCEAGAAAEQPAGERAAGEPAAGDRAPEQQTAAERAAGNEADDGQAVEAETGWGAWRDKLARAVEASVHWEPLLAYIRK
ncbi:dethiobiotin synthase [Paenibacillus athensensis]|nr:dethiobiotin synthase [Paenibacillus athensensis]MCD1258771.1 dethiobiotin synthase [Paenibacillus athensensis]